MLQNYREPNVYSKVTRRQPRVPETIVDLYPFVIGTGMENFAYENFTAEVTLAANETSITLPDVTNDDVVVEVSVFNGTVKLEGVTFELSEENVWKVTLTAAVSTEAETVLTVKYGIANKDRYKLQRFTGETADIEKFYGPIYDEAEGKINNISFGASIALESGSPVVYVLQIPSTTKEEETLADNYAAALEEYAVEVAGSPFWRIQPVDSDEKINEVIAEFTKEMSSVEERAEKFFGVNNIGAYDKTTPNEVIENFVSFINKYLNNTKKYDAYRMQTIYPNKAIYTFSTSSGDIDKEVGGEFIQIAIAGVEQSLDRPSQSLTNSVIPAGIFKSLVGVKMKRKQKNELAAYGVTILTQTTEGGNITIRDSLSMDVSDEQVSDPCVTRALDHGSKYVRGQLHPYIGKYNIEEELIAKAQASATTAFATLVQRNIFKSANITDIFQNEDDLNNLIIAARVGVLYPLKTIDVNIVCE